MDSEFNEIIKDIYNDSEVQKMALIKHHKGTRLEHSLKVAKKSYKIAKKLNLDYKSVARAGLLHDFFLEDYEKLNHTTKAQLVCSHGKIASKNAERFGLNEKERNIIEAHMFPIGNTIPNSKEAWLVNCVDKFSASTEKVFNFKMAHAMQIFTFTFVMSGIL